MNKNDHFKLVSSTIRNLHPEWGCFLDEFLEKIEPFWKDIHLKDQVNFIHLIGYENEKMVKMILINLMELLSWETEMVIFWNNLDLNAPSAEIQIQTFQETYPVFPRVILTNFLNDFYDEVSSEYNKCITFKKIECFLKDRKKLGVSNFGIPPSDGRGSLIISYLDSFGNCDFIRSRLILKFILENRICDFHELRKKYFPMELVPILNQGFIQRDELIFVVKDKTYFIELAFDIIEAKGRLENEAFQKIGIKVLLGDSALDYFLGFVFYKKLSFSNLIHEFFNFFQPLINEIPLSERKIRDCSNHIEIDFITGWKYKCEND